MRIVQAVDGNIMELFTHASAATDVADTIRVIAHVVNAKDNSPGPRVLSLRRIYGQLALSGSHRLRRCTPGSACFLQIRVRATIWLQTSVAWLDQAKRAKRMRAPQSAGNILRTACRIC